ncbi:MAG: TIGR03905 family TSCPD domain-containing protein [Planctomycetota bacterium]|jgi:uncharacterized protein (TIGR03905 family)|nr:TIGR03905 family TSCPD domain-containing protein [Planctomycetota bacterium]
MKKLVILPERVCCDRILVKVEDGMLRDVIFEGGCDGNGKALGRLLAGMPADKAMGILRGVDCEGKGTSCADQLARGLRENMEPDSGMNA